MNNSIIISRSKHLSLLADHRTDPITKKLFEVGDEVCVCAKCKTVYLKDVWTNTQRNSCCGQNLTLKKIPNATNIDFKKEKRSSKKAKKSYKGIFVFFFITTFIACVGCYYLYTENETIQNRYTSIFEQQQDKYTSTHYDKNKLDSTITYLKSKISVLKKEKQELQTRLNLSSQRSERLSAEVKNANTVLSSKKFITGVKYEEIHNYSLESSKTPTKIRFTVHRPIYFKSVKIEAEGSGFMTALIYDTNDRLVCEAYNGSIKDGLGVLNFYCMINKGEYYMTNQGNVSLTFISDYDEYPISDNTISIQDPQDEGTYYMNFYEWEYQIKAL